MDHETREFLEQIASRFDISFKELKNEMGELRGEMGDLRGEVGELRLSVKEQIEGSETRIVTAFWKWARPMEARMRWLDVSDAASSERLIGLEERMSAVERRLGLDHTSPAH